ncbi:hypothetical protein H2202_007544 [Exophiala xenobiotica]|nr:hypothetical protein H2202_007544 [Exophiala xenobiotica]KAK5191358.1 hypothetical protein LTR92_008529 [Exophiala xenobiotica]KAK5218180.1 hypothetical protein LTR72_008781 [Exophiala xenobiotica]KAK5289832.1 hypothetical protein LTR14_006848 [Exophiala xenobiotica]KAK5479075.1 hypothetical protein LTR55_007873 [Exophiala xenobiotica]
MSDISVTTVQAAVLLGTICFADSNTEAEALYYAVANRLAQILDLAHRPTTNETERQVNLRIWWTLYMIDIWCSTGLHLHRQMQSTHMVQLPADEVVFLGLEPRASSRPTTSGIWAQMADLAHIWADIYELNQSVIRETQDPHELEEAVETLLKRLEMWSAVLPLSLRKTRSNLDYYASVGLGSAFAALHLGYHYYTEVLCYQFLADGASSANPDYAERCKEHAKHFCDLLYLCLEIPNSECLYVMVGHMLVVSSTVYIHTLMFSDLEDEIAIARRRLEKNFQILMRLQSFWVKLDVSLSRLQAFHNACKISAEHSFGMDKWMLCFLLEHGVAVPERYPPTQIMAVTDSASPELTLQDWYSQTFSGG